VVLTKPRLRLFETHSLATRAKHATLEAAVGMVPAVVQVFEPKTKLDRRAFPITIRRSMTPSEQWGRGEVELFAAFVSSLNHCRF
jgi:hypothetical protein